tara:strand:- start:25556 stop:26056 length:501 start_codon:yes stop_codon:yes gene_type:complete
MTELDIASRALYGEPAFTGPVHASSVAIDGYAVLIGGPSGAGKSDLALRLIDRGALLISDDYTLVKAVGDDVIASAPPTIGERMEVRGLGVLPMPHVENVRVGLVVIAAGTGDDAPERYPVTPPLCRLCGIDVPLLRLGLLEASAPIKLEMALHHRNQPLDQRSES